MIKYFKVAGHFFSLSMPDTCSLWPRLTQYEPFETGAPEGKLLFGMELVRDMFDASAPRELVYDAPTEDGQTVIRLYREADGWSFDMSPDKSIECKAHLRTSADFTSARLYLDNRRVSDALFGINNALMLLYAFCSAPLGTLEMHASMTGNSGKAYLFLAKSGTGKSTHSSLWLEHIPGSELMNDDNPIVRAWPDGRVIAYGSPWSGKTPCYRNEVVDVGGFVLLSQAPFNKISRLKGVAAYAALVPCISGMRWDKEIANGIHQTENALASNVPVWYLECLPDEAAAKLCQETIA